MKTPLSPAPHPLALLGHELRTPLNAIIGYADAMRTQAFGPLAAPYDEQAGVIYAAALHLLALVDDMTDLARAEAGIWTGERRRLDAGAEAKAVVALLSPRARAAGLTIRVRIEPGGLAVLADQRALGQILINLLDNALKHAKPAGEVVLTLARDGHELRLTVTDSGLGGGRGIEAAAQGQGLGLRLVDALCAAQGGSLTLDTPPPGGGFQVTARLPLAAEA